MVGMQQVASSFRSLSRSSEGDGTGVAAQRSAACATRVWWLSRTHRPCCWNTTHKLARSLHLLMELCDVSQVYGLCGTTGERRPRQHAALPLSPARV